MTDKLLGITVFPEYIQSEGIERILDNLAACHANAVTLSPYVMAEADEHTGNREPPADAGAGSVRLLDRPLWGKRELFVRTSPSFVPDKKLYAGLRYQPAEPDELTKSEGHIVADFIAAAPSNWDPFPENRDLRISDLPSQTNRTESMRKLRPGKS